MPTSPEHLLALVTEPQESLGVELKQWIDPTKPEGQAKVVKGCLALRNHGGGHLVIGFTDSGSPDVEHAPADVRTLFHPDVIQELVAKYASERFEVAVHFVEREGQEYPVIEVPHGVRTPVAAKRDLSAGGKPLVKDHAVYVRSLAANNTVSSSEAKRDDWDGLMRTCFDNREADIGAFVRRHLAGLDHQHLVGLLGGAANTLPPTALERATALLERGRTRFTAVCRERSASVPNIGFREAAIVITGEVSAQPPSLDFLYRLTATKPRYSGWSPWVAGSQADPGRDPKYVFDGGWEALLAMPDSPLFRSIDFWRIDPRGEFYHLDGLREDLLADRTIAPGSVLDFRSQITRLVEYITAAQSFARTMGCDESSTSLACAFRWRGLAGRRLVERGDPTAFFRIAPAVQNEVKAEVAVPLEAATTALGTLVHRAVSPLLLVFGGVEVEERVITNRVQDVLAYRMG